MLAAAVVVGLGLGTLVPPDPVSVPLVGRVPGVVAGGVGLVTGGGAFALLKRSSGSGCGCSGDCEC